MTVSLKPLDQQVIVITGASSGIGLCTAESAVKQGAKVVLAARDRESLDQVVRRLTVAGGQAAAVAADVSDRQQVQRIADEALSRFGTIDTWVNNAGVGLLGRLDQVTDADSRRLFDINFWGVVYGCQVALPLLKSRGGALITVGSVASEVSTPLMGMYAASKHAVKGYVDALRLETEQVDRAPVSITLIEPPAIDTPFDEHMKNVTDKEATMPESALDPQQVADAILAAAVKPTRYTRVGTAAKVNTFVARNLPGLADRQAAKHGGDFQAEEPPKRPEGTLYQPGQGGRARGEHAGPQA